MNRIRYTESPQSYSLPIAQVTFNKISRRPLIKPSYALNGINSEETDPLVAFVEQTLYSILPQETLKALSLRLDYPSVKQELASICDSLPIIHARHPETFPCTFKVTTLCHSEFTSGVGRYLCDVFSRWLVPGKFLNISSVQSLNFSFVAYPTAKFFFQQIFLDIHEEKDLFIAKSNWEELKNDTRLNILAVRHARHVMAIKKLSFDEKHAIIQENIASVLGSETNAHDQMHRFLLQVTAEEKLNQIQEQFSPLFEQRPKAFQSEIFNELKNFIVLFKEEFTALHDLNYLSKLISYQYLFRKSLQHLLASAPNERHILVKLLKTKSTVLGIFGAMNVLREMEIFEERHLMQAIGHCLTCRKVENSLVLDRCSHDPIRIFYIEIEKKDGASFRAEEIKELQKNLPRELKESIETVIHPVFMPRNEEEIMRSILILSGQLKYVSDLPQVLISFDAQKENELIFRVILVRILKDTTPQVSTYPTQLQISDLEIKNVGMLRNKYLKEANVFKVALSKAPFLRKDFSIDLFKARQALASELNRMFDGIRDFNGGILSKQQEAFSELREQLFEIPYQDFLLENFFYSLTPPLHQNLIPPALLKSLFLLKLEAFEANYKPSPFFFKAQTAGDQLLIVIASPNNQLKEILSSIITGMHISASELCYTYLFSYEIHCFGYIYQNKSPSKQHLFHTALQEHIKNQFN